MSTKIYTGFRLGVKDNDELFQFLREMRERLTKALLVYIRDELITRDGKELKQWADLQQLHYNSWRDPRRTEFDGHCDASLFWYSRSWYGMLFCELSIFTELWFRDSRVKEFTYWDNTDRPENLSERVWERRKKVWRAILPGAGVPADNGLTVQLVPMFLPPPPEFTLKKDPIVVAVKDAVEKVRDEQSTPSSS